MLYVLCLDSTVQEGGHPAKAGPCNPGIKTLSTTLNAKTSRIKAWEF